MATERGSLDHYVIRGGEAGKKRLDLLAAIMEPSTKDLLTRLGVGPGKRFLDLGCGGGHVSLLAASLVKPDGAVTGVDLDATKLDLARETAAGLGADNVRFVNGNAADATENESYDFAYARFLLTHLGDPLAVLRVMQDSLKPGGIVVVEDIDASGSFCYPESAHYERFVELYRTVVRRKGGDPDIGPKLPSWLRRAGFAEIQVGMVQPLHLEGDHKHLMLSTLENIAEPVIAEGLATEEEVRGTIEGLTAFTLDPTTVVAMPRIVQSWGVKPA